MLDNEREELYELPILCSKIRNDALGMFKKALNTDLDDPTKKKRDGRINSIVVSIESGKSDIIKTSYQNN